MIKTQVCDRNTAIDVKDAGAIVFQEWCRRVRPKRLVQGLSLRALAAQTGISMSYLAKIERGEAEASNPSRKVIETICHFLNLPVPILDYQAETQEIIPSSESGSFSEEQQNLKDIANQVLAVLFVYGKLPVNKLCKIMNTDTLTLKSTLPAMQDTLKHLPFSLYQNGQMMVIETKPEFGEIIQRAAPILDRPVEKRLKLTPSQLEVLAVIAMHEPLTLGSLEKIRGCSCYRHIAILQDLDLIKAIEHSQVEETAYTTTRKFHQLYGLPAS